MADASAFRRVAETVLCDKTIKIIVVSAGGRLYDEKKVTDVLSDAYICIKRGESPNTEIAKIIDRVGRLKRELRLKSTPEYQLMKIENDVVSSVAPDFLLSRGEYIYSTLFAEFAAIPFIDARELYKFNSDGTINREYTYYCIRRAFKETGRFVTGGFYGEDEDGKIRTFSRGGGDVSGAMAARAICADEFVDYTDVDGVYPYNPKLIECGSPVKELSYGQIRLLGEFGASVLHRDSVLPLEDKGIVAVVKNTFDNSCDGTKISTFAPKDVFAAASLEGCVYARFKSINGCENTVKVAAECGDVAAITANADSVEVVYKSRVEVNADTCAYIENNVVLFYVTAGERGDDFVKRTIERLKTLYIGKFKEGYFIAVCGDCKKHVETLIEECVKE